MEQRYYELYDLSQQDGYELTIEEREEFNLVCSELLKDIMIQNQDIFIRLKDR
ncbi:hypothetical protein UFOVP84_101 [uncultured Caudovirales phage]|uniref:Uncharacterized protein n=1 Tax=uncultured Caudovirales phage TaxID=2100421 RepID=A0A6J5L1S2_9CAUD|nr:hypothetical protein UFOVP84_101 [uncultured Caudovirales phage]